MGKLTTAEIEARGVEKLAEAFKSWADNSDGNHDAERHWAVASKEALTFAAELREKSGKPIVLQGESSAVAYRYKLKNNFCRWVYSDGIPPNKSDKFQEELLFTHHIKVSIELPDVESGKYWFEHDGRMLFDGVEFNNDVLSAIKMARRIEGNADAE